MLLEMAAKIFMRYRRHGSWISKLAHKIDLALGIKMPREENLQYLTVKEVADILGFHPETIKRWARDGKIEFEQFGHYGHLRIAWPLRKKRSTYINNHKVQQGGDWQQSDNL
jgi:excisionase family DNA binding protein